MRISDWSSDVCSSDLRSPYAGGSARRRPRSPVSENARQCRPHLVGHVPARKRKGHVRGDEPDLVAAVVAVPFEAGPMEGLDRKSVVKGQSVSCSVCPGGRLTTKKKTKKKKKQT